MKKIRPLHLYLFLASVGVISFIVLNRVFNGYFFGEIFSELTRDPLHDFFVFLNQTSTIAASFLIGANPPLVRFVFRFVFKSLPEETQASHVEVKLNPEIGNDLRIDAFSSLCFFLMFIFALVFIARMCDTKLKGSGVQKTLFVILAILSTGVVWSIERGNIVIWAMAATMYFCFNYDSEDKNKKEISYLLLGIASSLKIYPVLFGLFLLRKKNYKGIIKTILYVALFTILPLLAVGGVDGVFAYINSLFGQVTSGSNLRVGYLNGVSVMFTAFRVIGHEGFFLNHLVFFKIFNYAFCIIVSIMATFLLRKEWMRITILVFAMYWLPGITHTYMLSFVIIPLIVFLNEEDEISLQNIIAVIGFVILTTVLPIPNGRWILSLRDQTVVNAANRLSGIMMLHILGEIILATLIIVILIKEFVMLVRCMYEKKKQQSEMQDS